MTYDCCEHCDHDGRLPVDKHTAPCPHGCNNPQETGT